MTYPSSQQSVISAIQSGALTQAQSCDRKAKYRTFEIAEKVAHRREYAGAPKLRVYLCPFCGTYHLTSRPA